MNVERVVVVDGRKDFPEPGQVMVDLLVKLDILPNEHTPRCVVVFTDYGVEYVRQDFPIGAVPNLWWAVKQVMDKINQGEPIAFPLDITAEVAKGPW